MNGILISSYSLNPKTKQKNRNVLLIGLFTASILAVGFITAAFSKTTVKSCECTNSHCMCGNQCPCGSQCNCR